MRYQESQIPSRNLISRSLAAGERSGVAFLAFVTGLIFVLFVLPAVSETIGWIERIKIGDQGFLIEAKMDTGADSSSLSAQNIDVYSRGTRFWVRFQVTNSRNEKTTFDVPVQRFVKIKRHGGKSIERPVVEIAICLGRLSRKARVTLADRSRFKFAALIGREFLSTGKLVDSSRRYLMEPNCNSRKE